MGGGGTTTTAANGSGNAISKNIIYTESSNVWWKCVDTVEDIVTAKADSTYASQGCASEGTSGQPTGCTSQFAVKDTQPTNPSA